MSLQTGRDTKSLSADGTFDAGPELRAGVIGLGWAGQTHLAAYARLPGVRPIALSAQERDLVEDLATEHDIRHRFSSWEELVELPELDIVSVCTPNALHAPIAIAALANGKHVLCEKPLARHAIEGEAMCGAAEKAGRVLEVAFNFRHYPAVTALRSAISAGLLGSVYHAKASWLWPFTPRSHTGWFTRLDQAGGGALIDRGVHILDLTLHLLGSPTVTSASAATSRELISRGSSAADVEDFGFAMLRLSDDTTIDLEVSWSTYADVPGDITIELFGTDGGATLRIFAEKEGPWLRSEALLHGAERKVDVLHSDSAGALIGHAAVVDEFLYAIRTGDWDKHRGQTGLSLTRVLDTCYESARVGRELRVVGGNVESTALPATSVATQHVPRELGGEQSND